MEQKKMTGYPSLDKPWLKYYSEEAIHAKLPLGSMFEYLVQCNKEHLDDVALIYFGRYITYRELFRQIDLIASALVARGIQEGDTVSIISLNTPEAICTFYALNKIGAVACLEYVTQTPEALSDSLRSVHAKMVFVLDMFFSRFEKTLLHSGTADIVLLPLSGSMNSPLKLIAALKKPRIPKKSIVVPFSSFVHTSTSAPVHPVYGGHAAALMISTSGTTGTPKKVIHSSFNINSIVFQYQTSGMIFRRGEIYLSMAPLFLAFGITLAIHLPLCTGVTGVICLDPDAKKTIAMFAKYRPNHFLCGDYHMLELISNPAIQNMNLSFLRTVAIGGESLSMENVQKVNDFLHEHASPVGLITGYGMTELGATAVTEMNTACKLGSVGIPQSMVTVKIVDTETGKEKTYDETGEIMIQAPGIMLEYWNNPQETNQTIEIDEQRGKWIHTGDLGRVDRNGFVYIQGRIKRIYQRFLPGTGTIYKVFPDYIEKILSEHHAVKHCAVVCTECKEVITVPVAFIVLKQQIDTPELVLSKYILAEAGDYNVPARFIFKTELPLLANGKIDYRALEREAQNG